MKGLDVDVVILCGGKGSRLGALTRRTPKPLLPIGGEPFLSLLLKKLKQEGFSRFALAIHHRADCFEEFLGRYRTRFPGLRLVLEPLPLGTGGALKNALSFIQSSTWVALNGDSWVEQTLRPVLEAHERQERDFTGVAVQANRVVGAPVEKGFWHSDPSGKGLEFSSRPLQGEGWVNAGAYVLSRSLVASWPGGAYSLETHLGSLLEGRRKGLFYSQGRLLDIGTPDCLAQADLFLKSQGESVVQSQLA
ncbi:MAG: NTP transferase domain-containing protein [Candidatus Omnitrophica bacterium]|nr:NTP transferase domain-containing protein [Candidatus Omnitrophota bacterium]